MHKTVFPNATSFSGRLRYFMFLAGLCLAVLLICQSPVYAQNATGHMSGVVTDSSGAVVPDAKVVLKDEQEQTTRDTVSNGSGFFNFEAVRPTTYTLTVSAAGFTTWEERGIPFSQGASISIPNIVLQVGGTKSEVAVVAANDVIVPTDTGQISTTLNTHMISQISLAGRDAAELIKIMPGMGATNGLSNTASFDQTHGTANNTGPIGSYSANGTQPYGSMTMTSDGANLLDPGNQGTQTANINTDQTAEVTLLTNAFGAEFAKGPITFQAIGKSGGAQFHGQGYFYERNGIMNAEDSYLKNQGLAKPEDHYYYPGGDFGGPVLIPGTRFNHDRNKLFFYSAFEYMWQQQAGSLNSYFIPTAQMMAGNFSPSYLASLGPYVKTQRGGSDETTIGTGPCNCASLFPGGMIPANLLDTNSNAYWKTYPQPNADPTANTEGANYQYLVAPPQNRWELRLRGDYNISDNTKLFFSWNRQDEQDQNPISVWWSLPGGLPYPTDQIANQQSNVYSSNLTHVFSPTLTNEFVFAEATFLNPINLANPAAVDPSKVGFQIQNMFPAVNGPYTPQIPNVFSWEGFAGYSAYNYGDKGFSAGFGKLSQAPNVSDNLSKVWGTHTLKVGFYWDYARNQQTAGGLQFAVQGAAGFENWGATSTGNPLADFATGRVTDFNQANGYPTDDMKYYQYSFYGQDSWKVNRRLTVTYGLRFDHMGQWVPNGTPGLAVWDPAAYVQGPTAGAYTGLVWHATDSAIPISGFPSKPFFYEPRVGAAYDLFGNGKTVLRGGFGVYRYQLAYNSVSGGALNDPLGYETASTTWGCCVGWEQFNQYSPALGLAGLGTAPGGVLQMGDSRTPYSETYNFTISQRVPWNSVAEFQYSGNISRDMLIDSGLANIDKVPIGAFFGPDPVTGVVQNPSSTGFTSGTDYNPLREYTGLTLVTHGSFSNYNGFIATWQKQTGRLTFTTNYTFSKALGIRDGETDNGAGQGQLLDSYNINNNYGVLGFDHTQLFNAAYVINLPSPVHGNMFLGGVVNGWELSGITQLSSGAPIQPNSVQLGAQFPSTFDGINYGQQGWFGTSSMQLGNPTLVVTCNPNANLQSGQYFNPACFAPETTWKQQGTLIWPYIKGPAFFNSDLSLYKNFAFKEHQNLQFRFQAYNFLNHPLPSLTANGADLQLDFNNNNVLSMTNINALTDGKAANTQGRRVIMLSLKYNF